MIPLSIITINRNDAEGLRRTIKSVAEQVPGDTLVGASAGTLWEHIIIDGASTDASVGVIEQYASEAKIRGRVVRWISEPDKGIYHAMNKGIRMAQGEYIQILNAGDCLAATDVTKRILYALYRNTQSSEQKTATQSADMPDILYGNMLKVDGKGKLIGKSGYTEYSLRQFYSSTLNHDCAYIRRALFDDDHYGLYDENLRIVSDWKWYLQAIGLGKVRPVYADIDVTIFDGGGISETNLPLRAQERRLVLEEVLPPAVLWDYDHHAFDMEQMNRLRRHHLYPLVYFMERVLFKLEKWGWL